MKITPPWVWLRWIKLVQHVTRVCECVCVKMCVGGSVIYTVCGGIGAKVSTASYKVVRELMWMIVDK